MSNVIAGYLANGDLYFRQHFQPDGEPGVRFAYTINALANLRELEEAEQRGEQLLAFQAVYNAEVGIRCYQLPELERAIADEERAIQVQLREQAREELELAARASDYEAGWEWEQRVAGFIEADILPRAQRLLRDAGGEHVQVYGLPIGKYLEQVVREIAAQVAHGLFLVYRSRAERGTTRVAYRQAAYRTWKAIKRLAGDPAVVDVLGLPVPLRYTLEVQELAEALDIDLSQGVFC